MRLSSLDHLRGFGIILVLVFSLWQWMYYPTGEFGLFVHNRHGEFHFGDLILSLFLFCSGVSVWFYYGKLVRSSGSIADAEKKFLLLALSALVISGAHLFGFFPDEVLIIAACDILLFNLLWHKASRTFLFAYSLLLPLLMFALQSLQPEVWKLAFGYYLGGWLGIAYWLVLVILGAIIAQDAFPNGKFEQKKPFKAIEKWLAVLLFFAAVTALLSPIDKMNLSPSFLPVSALYTASLFWLFLHLFEARKLNIGFLRLMGAHSLWGWGLLFFVSGAIWFNGSRGDFDPSIYFPFCLLLLILLCAALWIKERFGKKQGKKPGA